MVQTDGTTFEGEWQNDLYHGKGTQTYPNGSYFKGTFENGFRQGKGFLQLPDKSTYRGNFFENRLEGKGVFKWADGKVYQGSWVQNQMHGNRINREPQSRWSMNCRFKSVFSPYKDKKLGEFFEPITLRPATQIALDYQIPGGFNAS